MGKRVFEDLEIKKGLFDSEIFDGLPQRAKSIFFSAIEHTAIHYPNSLTSFVMCWCDEYDTCTSPIEKILFLAFRLVEIVRSSELCEKSVAIIVTPQYEIDTGKKRYYADFYINIESYIEDVGVIVECDGQEFHQKTKKQVEHDNEREYEIKKCGYDILRFSGSQIYNNPFKCANDIFDYLLMKEKK